MKTCSKCHIEKDESEFRKTTKGVRSACKRCDQLQRKIRLEITGKEKEYSRNSYLKNKEKHNLASKTWAEKNRIKSREIKKRWNDKNKEYKKNHYLKNKKDVLNNAKNKYRNNTDEIKKRVKEYAHYVRDNLEYVYLKERLKREGFTNEKIEIAPQLIDIKKTEILIHRLKKKTNGKKSINGSPRNAAETDGKN